MENKILAKVAGRDITEKELDAIIMRYPEDRRAYVQTEQGKKQLLEQVISFELFNKFGVELGVDKTQEFEETVDALRKEILTQMTITKIMNDVTVTDEDAKAYYDNNSDKFSEQETVSAKHILVETMEQAEKIKEEIEAGEVTFEEAAMKYSSCPSKEQGGNLGVFGKGMMVPEFENVAFDSEVNKVSDVVQTQFGYHIILVEAKNEGTVKTFDEVKDVVINQLLQERQQVKYLDITKELTEKYGVDRM
ncbi:MAG: peptidylprolyl isomerase [Clostridium sp.]